MLHLPAKFPAVDLFNTDPVLSDRKLFAERLEIENAHLVTEPYWHYLNEHFQERLKLPVGKNITKSLYLDSDELDILQRAHRTFRGRPKGISSDGEVYPDQLGVKFRHARGQATADDIMRQLFPGINLHRPMPRVRQEVEVAHHHEKEVRVYTADDLPLAMFSELNKVFHFQELKRMSFSPLFATFAPRNKYVLFLDPESKSNSSLILDPNQPYNRHNTQICIEVGLDECHYKLPEIGMSMAAMFRAASHDLTTLQRAPEDRWLVEHELKPKECGRNATDGGVVWAYARFVIMLYDLAKPFKRSREHVPIKPVGSKGARGFKPLIMTIPRWQRFSDSRIWTLAP